MNRRGLTLIELVVALTVTGAALAAGYGAFAQLVDQRERVAQATDGVARAAQVRGMLTAWIGGARVAASGGEPEFRGLDGSAGTVPDDELVFLTDARTPLGEVATVVRIAVDRDPSTPERGLVAHLAEWRGTGTIRLELEPAVDGFDARYVSRVLGGNRWLPSWISRTLLPRGVELTFSPARGDSLPALLTVPVTVLVAGGR